MPVDPVPLVLAVVDGLALVVTAARTTTIGTPSPERAQIPILPLTSVLPGAGGRADRLACGLRCAGRAQVPVVPAALTWPRADKSQRRVSTWWNFR